MTANSNNGDDNGNNNGNNGILITVDDKDIIDSCQQLGYVIEQREHQVFI